ncbi:MAG: hypothetical protein U0625_13490 [Phycisphaerales bacterium]
MASKINKKFVLVAGGFTAAAVVLLGAVLFINYAYLQNADRHIAKGDALMAEGKYRDAFQTYGRAVSKKPNEIRYIEKMEEALGKTVAENAGKATEDYRQMLALKKQRTRAQPGDPAQWQAFIDSIEAESELTPGSAGMMAIESAAKEMKDVMAPGSPGAKLAREYLAWARGMREAALSSTDRADAERQLQDLVKEDPGSWRGWTALVQMQIEDAVRLRDQGQASASTRRMEEADKSLAAMRQALGGKDGMAKVALAMEELERVRADARAAGRIDATKLDAAKVKAASAALAAAAQGVSDGRVVRAAANLMAESGEIDQCRALIDAWVAGHADDLLAANYQLELLGRAANSDPASFEKVRAAAQKIMERPQLPTSLMANAQAEVRARAIQVLMDGTIAAIQRDPKSDASKAKFADLDALRAKLLESAANNEQDPRVIAADARILQAKGSVAEAARKWELYFTKLATPPGDSFVAAADVARAQGDLGLALQRATKGLEIHPTDLRLALMRAELTALLGRFDEAAAYYEAISRALPDNQELPKLVAELRSRGRAGGGNANAGVAKEITDIETAVKAKDFAKARQLADAWVAGSSASLASLYAQMMVEVQAGDKAKALELARAALAKYPNTMDVARVEAALMTEDPVERVEIVIDRMVADPKQRAAERLRAYRTLRTDLERQLADAKIVAPTDAARLQKQVDSVAAKLAEAEKSALANAADDPAVIESTFNEAIQRGDFAAAEAQLIAAGKQTQLPELEVVLRSTLLDAQGKTAEAIKMLEEARAKGRNEAPVAARLAVLQEKVGNEPAAFALWKEAYERRPNDVTNVRGYARAMSRAGQGRQALEIVRAAAAANPGDPLTQAQAAQFEAVYGSRARAAQIRAGLFRSNPSDRENIAELYALLYMPPEPASVVDANGRPRYEAREWAAVPIDERRRLLDEAGERNRAIAEQLYDASVAGNPDDLRVPIQKARIMRDMGTPEKGTESFKKFIESAEARKTISAVMMLEYGAHLLAVGDEAGADAAFARAVALQDPARREADLALVEIEARRNRVPKAIEALQRAMGQKPTLQGLLRLADLQIVARRWDDAVKSAEQARALAGAAPTVEVQRTLEMITAGVAAGRADDLVTAGRKTEADAQVAIAMDALGKAAAVAPMDYMAPLRRIQLMRTWGRGSNDAAKIDAAIAEADRLLARNTLLWPAVQLRSDLALDKRDTAGAIAIVDRFVQAQPSSDDGRSRLVDLYALSGNYPRAIDVARAGADLAPQSVFWAQRLGELLAVAGQHSAAAKEYDRALGMEPRSVALLAAAAEARLNAKEAADALAMLRLRNELVAANPNLRAYAAAALNETGRRPEAAVAAREALTAARAAKKADQATEEALRILRRIYTPDRAADYEALLTQGATPTPLEAVTIAEQWARSGPDGIDKALSWADKVLAAGDSTLPAIRAGAQMVRGGALYGKGDLAGACDAFERAAELVPTNPAALNNAAYLLIKVKNDPAKALPLAEKAVTIAPAQAEYLDTLGLAQLKSGKAQQAEETLGRAMSMGESASAAMHLAQAKAALGKTSEAQQAIDRARRLATDPDTKKEVEETASNLSRK